MFLGNANQLGGSADLHEGVQYGGAHLPRNLIGGPGAATTGFVSLGQGHLSKFVTFSSAFRRSRFSNFRRRDPHRRQGCCGLGLPGGVPGGCRLLPRT